MLEKYLKATGAIALAASLTALPIVGTAFADDQQPSQDSQATDSSSMQPQQGDANTDPNANNAPQGQ